MSDLLRIHNNFYSHSSKKEQDDIILKFCTITASNKNSKNEHKYKGKKQTIIKYAVIAHKRRIPVCQKIFLHLRYHKAQSGICHAKVLSQWRSRHGTPWR